MFSSSRRIALAHERSWFSSADPRDIKASTGPTLDAIRPSRTAVRFVIYPDHSPSVRGTNDIALVELERALSDLEGRFSLLRGLDALVELGGEVLGLGDLCGSHLLG